MVCNSYCTMLTKSSGTAQELLISLLSFEPQCLWKEILQEKITFKMFSILFYSFCFPQINVCRHHCVINPTVFSLWALHCRNALMMLPVAAS